MADNAEVSKEAVGARLRLTREALDNMSQARLCALMGEPMYPSKWNNYETGDYYPPYPELVRFCQVTGATTDWIIRGVRHTLPATLLDRISGRENALARVSKRRRA